MKKIAAIAALTLATSAQAGVISFSDSIAIQSTNWNSAVSIGKFDTTLGMLTSITFSLEGIVNGQARAESLDAQPATVTLDLAGEIKLQRPDMSVLVTTNPVVSSVFNLAAFDGTIDFAGASGVDTGSVSASASDALTSTSAADFLLFSAAGGGVINMPVLAAGLSTGSGAGNLVTQFTTLAGANVTVTYNYTDAPTSSVPEPGTLAMAGLGLLGLGAMRRRK